MKHRATPIGPALAAIALVLALISASIGCLRSHPAPRATREATGNPPSVLPPRDDLARAIALLREGRGIEGEALLQERVRRVREEHGDRSAAYAAALYDLGTMQFASGDHTRALQSLRAAEAIPPVDRESEREHLSHNMNLGLFLIAAGDPVEAERVLREGLAGRERHYGRAHAGYAFGLEPLALALALQGRHDEARRLTEEALGVLVADGHPRRGALIVLRAAVVLARDPEADPGLARLASEPAEVWEEAVAALEHATSAALFEPVAVAMVPVVAQREGPGSAGVGSALWMALELARRTGDAARRAAAADRVVAWADDNGAADDAIEARLERAFVDSNASRTEEALRRYRETAALAARASPISRARAQLELGIVLDHTEAHEEARQWLERSIASARSAPDPDVHATLGRALSALGVARQHAGEHEGVEALLVEAVAHLPEAHPDALATRSHLRSLRAGEACDCARQMPEVLADLALTRLRQQLGELVIGVEPDPEAPLGWRARFAREPTEDERASAELVLRQTAAEIARRGEAFR